MKRYLEMVAVLFLLFIVPVSAQTWMYSTDTAYMHIELSSDIELVEKAGSTGLDYLKADLLFYPRDDPIQKAGAVNIAPANYELLGDGVSYNWQNPSQTEFAYSYEADVSVKNKLVKVTKRIPFPIKELPEELVQYTLATETIDATDRDIQSTAASLAAGEDDLYVIVHNVGSWIDNNIDYSLDTLTAEASQKASWVMEHRYGVCDEITTLFIAMLRSLGIPVRYIGGVAYTNWQEMDDWGSHAWAEVYFPGYGWVAFDITYGQLGFIDNSHISLKKSADIDSTSTEFEWLGYGYTALPGTLDIQTELTSSIGFFDVPLELDVDLYRDEVGFGSYNIVEVNVENTAGYYYPTQIILSKMEGVAVLGGESRHILMKPYSSEKLYWVIMVSEEFDSGYSYKFPVVVQTVRNVTARDSFTSTAKSSIYTYDDIKEIVELEQVEETATTSQVSLGCAAEKKKYYTDEEIFVICEIGSKEDLGSLDVCMVGKCQDVSLGAGSSESLNFEFYMDLTGRRDIIVTARNKDVAKATSFAVEMVSRPSISVTSVVSPREVRFGETFEVSFVLEKGESYPKNVVIELDQGGSTQKWMIEELINDKKFVITTDSTGLKEGANFYDVKVTYHDDDLNEYVTQESFSVSLVDVTGGQKFQIFLNQIAKWLGNLLS